MTLIYSIADELIYYKFIKYNKIAINNISKQQSFMLDHPTQQTQMQTKTQAQRVTPQIRRQKIQQQNESQLQEENEFKQIATQVKFTRNIEDESTIFQHTQMQQRTSAQKNSRNGIETLNQNFVLKMNYYNTLVSQNKEMHNHIKYLNSNLDKKIGQIQMKKYTSIQKYKPQVKPQRTGMVQQKYKQLDEYKMQLKCKLIQKKSIQQFISRVDKLKSRHKEIFTEIEQKTVTLNKLKQMVQKKYQQQEIIVNNSLLNQNASVLYRDQIKELKQKIKGSEKRIYEQKQKFISCYKQNAEAINSKDHMDYEQNNDNIAMGYRKYKRQQKQRLKNNKGKQKSVEQVPRQQQKQAIQLKKEYQQIGRNIQILKNRKKQLMMISDLSQRQKYLIKLKNKFSQLSKL